METAIKVYSADQFDCDRTVALTAPSFVTKSGPTFVLYIKDIEILCTGILQEGMTPKNRHRGQKQTGNRILN